MSSKEKFKPDKILRTMKNKVWNLWKHWIVCSWRSSEETEWCLMLHLTIDVFIKRRRLSDEDTHEGFVCSRAEDAEASGSCVINSSQSWCTITKSLQRVASIETICTTSVRRHELMENATESDSFSLSDVGKFSRLSPQIDIFVSFPFPLIWWNSCKFTAVA